ncbi:hypothetical protein HV560_00910 [Mannheimia pernigra]|uniref:YD repeat-containing protein n=1 Tax=Mannheimia pernigra TaxID=111844 RepID=A0ABD7A674_9PAST|nr:hypothetical protein [Mannheimia pernigra]QLB41509.1 hypothetical protein HV560_00910 [Mannheimia pernigra]
MTKQGFERVENYTYDTYGSIIDTATDVAGDNIAVNSRTTSERDEFGRDKVVRNFQADGTLVWKREYEYNEYDALTKETHYSSETRKNSIHTYSRDEFDRPVIGWDDKNANGIFDAGDVKYSLSFSNDARSLLMRRKNTVVDISGKETSQDFNYVYNEKVRVREFIDLNNNQKADSNELVTHITYTDDTGLFVKKFEYSYGLDKKNIFESWHFIFPDAGTRGVQIAGIRTDIASGETYMSYGVHGSHYSTKDDYTSSSWNKLFDEYKSKLEAIYLTNNTANTILTVDNDVIAKIAKNQMLRINGDATDTVRLKNHAEFKEIENVKQGKNDYKQYTTEVDGQQYTLLIDTDINVVLA